jgi:hypothetical protein
METGQDIETAVKGRNKASGRESGKKILRVTSWLKIKRNNPFV